MLPAPTKWVIPPLEFCANQLYCLLFEDKSIYICDLFYVALGKFWNMFLLHDSLIVVLNRRQRKDRHNIIQKNKLIHFMSQEEAFDETLKSW